MEIIISACVLLVGIFMCRGAERISGKTIHTRSQRLKLQRMNTLLHNIEVYDGSAKGQKRIGGEKR